MNTKVPLVFIDPIMFVRALDFETYWVLGMESVTIWEKIVDTSR